MARQYWVAPVPPFHIADGTALTGGVILGDISPQPPIVLPANTLEIGSRLEIQAFGRFSCAATSMGTVVLGLYLNAGAINATNAVCVTAASPTLIASSTNRTWRLEANCSVRSVGTTGTILGCAEISNITGASPLCDTLIAPQSAPATLTIDTTTALKVMIGATPSATTQSWQCMYLGVRLVN